MALSSKQRKEELVQLIAQYGSRLESLYDDYIGELSSLGYGLDVLESNALFKFDQFPNLKERLNNIFQDYFTKTVLCYRQGMTSGVTLAFMHDTNTLGEYSVLNDKTLSKIRDNAANTYMQSRLKTKKGLNLSQRVWNYCSQTKSEFEMALSNVIADGLKKGSSAEAIGRSVRQYLKDPDRMYRRYHTVKTLVNGQKQDVVTWRRRKIIDGKVRFVEEPLEKVGAGVYRSSRMNALRLARTEINGAYLRGHNARWANEPFVIGQYIHVSPQHKINDICNDLQGRYPKDFIFSGWHPSCMCTADPVMLGGEEKKQFYDKMYAGEDMTDYVSPNAIDDVPKDYKQYITDNEARIVSACRKDNLAWHLADNKQYWQNLCSVENQRLMGVKRELTREEKIKQAADKRHAERNETEIKQQWAQRQKRVAQERAYMHYGEHVLQYMSGIKDVDAGGLKKAIDAKDYSKIFAEANNLKAVGKKILSFTRLDKPMEVARKYSMSEASTINSAVEKRLARESSELAHRKQFLESEIRWVEVHKKYDTWKVAQDAYRKELRIVEKKIEIEAIKGDISDALAYASTSRSAELKTLASEMKSLMSKPPMNIDTTAAKAKAEELNKKYKKLFKNKQKNKSAASSSIKKETLKQLKKRLGSEFPKTLEHLNDAISSYEKTNKYGDKAKQYKDEIEELMRNLFDKHDLGMNIQDKTLDFVLNSKFMNTFESGTSGGYLGSTLTTGAISEDHGRLKAAHKLFGLPRTNLAKQQLARTEYEKYGNLLDHDILSSMQHNTATCYGNVEVRFKKDKVVATWTAGDSLGEIYQPSLVSDPKSCSFDNISRTPTTSKTQTDNLAKFKDRHINTYLELQYHGQLTIDCIESITYPYDLKDGLHDTFLKTAQAFKKKGAKIHYIKNNTLYDL